MENMSNVIEQFKQLVGEERYYLKIKTTSIKDALIKVVTGHQTFYKDRSLQCSCLRNRSISDLFRTVLGQYPEASLEEIGKELKIILLKKWSVFRCNNIGKYVVDAHTTSERRKELSDYWDIDGFQVPDGSCNSIEAKFIKSLTL